MRTSVHRKPPFISAAREACTLRIRKYLFTDVNRCAYTSIVTETTATEFGDSIIDRRTTAAARFFYVRTPLRAITINGRAWAGRPSGLPVSYRAGSPTPFSARSPYLAIESGSHITSIGGRTMLRHIPARLEQPLSPLEIIQAALRAAALAPTVFDALDVTGDALRRLAELARDEVQK